MRLPAKQAFTCWFGALALCIVALFAFLGPPGSADGSAEAIGRLFALSGLSALFSWWLARTRTPAWSWGRFVLVYAAMFVVVAVIASNGHARSG